MRGLLPLEAANATAYRQKFSAPVGLWPRLARIACFFPPAKLFQQLEERGAGPERIRLQVLLQPFADGIAD